MSTPVTNVSSVLIVRGAFGDIYEPAWERAFRELGVRCEFFDSHALTLPSLLGRVERRILWGPGVQKIRKELIRFVRERQPDVTLLYQGHYFDAQTLLELQKHTFVAGRHDDDPFGPRRGMLKYRILLGSLHAYQGFHVNRQVNVEEVLRLGVPRVAVSMNYYLPWMDYPREVSRYDQDRFGSDLVFAGHWEDDLRVECLVRAVRAGIRVRIFGGDRFWKPSLPKDVRRRVGPMPKLYGEDYRKALCSSKIATAFYSKWNRDEYTNRSFEIPACGAFLLSERTPKMVEMFEEEKEAVYFTTPDQFVDKARYYLSNTESRIRIAEAGRRRVLESGHDIYSRVRQWMEDVSRWKSQDQ